MRSAKVCLLKEPRSADAGEAILVLNGKMGRDRPMSSGTVAWVSEGTWSPLSHGVKFLAIPLPPPCMETLAATGIASLETRHGRPIHVASKLAFEVQEASAGTEFVQTGLQWELGGYLVRMAKFQTTPLPAWLSEADQYIESHLSEPVRLSDLAQEIQVTARRLSEGISVHLGYSFREFIIRKRLDAACRLLIQTNLSVGEIAARTGFSDHAHMTREFRRFIGVPPSEYASQD